MFEWLSRLIDSVLSWVPRLVHITRTHGAVVFTGANAKVWRPGLHVYWPLISEYVELPVVRQTHNAATQVILTAEGRNLAVSGVIVYEIVDMMDALSRSWEVDDTIGDISLTAIMEVMAGEPLDDLAAKQKDGRLARELTLKTRKRLRPFGVKVLKTSLTDFATCTVIKHLGEGMVVPSAEDE